MTVKVLVPVVVEALVVLVVTTPVPGYKHVHCLEMELGLLEQYEAHVGRAAVAVTVDSVKVAQKADAVAPLADRYEAQESDSGFVQASTTGNKPRKALEYMLLSFCDG